MKQKLVDIQSLKAGFKISNLVQTNMYSQLLVTLQIYLMYLLHLLLSFLNCQSALNCASVVDLPLSLVSGAERHLSDLVTHLLIAPVIDPLQLRLLLLTELALGYSLNRLTKLGILE